MKTTIVINGAGGVGKDTLCEFASEQYRTVNVSSIDPIKEAAKVLGWDEKKDLKSRKFLSDLKKLVSEYNDWPTKYLVEKHNDFCQSDNEILFVHIREGNEISHFVESVSGKVVTLLVRRENMAGVYGNKSDDDVEKFDYDYIYHNNLPLEEVKEDFLKFLKEIME